MKRELVIAAMLSAISVHAPADVVQQSPTGFTVHIEQTLPYSNEQVYAGLGDLPGWWSSAHSFSGSAANLSIDLRADGCFCESWQGGSVEHLRVIAALPGREVRLRGGLGPLQKMPVDGLMQWRIVPQGEKSVLTWEYRVWGGEANQLQRIAAPVDSVLSEQFLSLTRYLQAGAGRKESAGEIEGDS
ncbi:ATPase [Microbulbifer hainanensis]|uniref:ATPase n=1 Tax=Microbulbifer hainanensis TaxID=2735675 RepID=UPI001866E79A|nr:ATPase [Microbulbifer hainanensis]